MVPSTYIQKKLNYYNILEMLVKHIFYFFGENHHMWDIKRSIYWYLLTMSWRKYKVVCLIKQSQSIKVRQKHFSLATWYPKSYG